MIAVPWYAVMLWKFGWHFFDEFFIHENWHRLIRAEHPANNHWWYYPGLLALGSIPWMPVLAIAVNRAVQGLRHDSRLVFLWSWILSSLVFLSIVQSKLPSYIFYVFVPARAGLRHGARRPAHARFSHPPRTQARDRVRDLPVHRRAGRAVHQNRASLCHARARHGRLHGRGAHFHLAGKVALGRARLRRRDGGA